MTTPPPPPDQIPNNAGQPNSSDAQNFAQVAHFGMAVFGFIPALIIYLIKGEDAWVKSEAAKAFNFSVALTIISVFTLVFRFFLGSSLSGIGIFEAVFGCGLCLIGIGAYIFQMIFGILNGIRISNGESTSYPFELPLLNK